MGKFKIWPNAERHVIRWLNAHTDLTIYSILPNNFGDHLPAAKVARTGGSPAADTVTGARVVGNDKTIDIEVTVHTRTRGELWPAAQQVETAMGGLAANGDAEWYVDDVTEVFPFAVDNYENEEKQRATATFGLLVRPVP